MRELLHGAVDRRAQRSLAGLALGLDEILRQLVGLPLRVREIRQHLVRDSAPGLLKLLFQRHAARPRSPSACAPARALALLFDQTRLGVEMRRSDCRTRCPSRCGGSSAVSWTNGSVASILAMRRIDALGFRQLLRDLLGHRGKLGSLLGGLGHASRRGSVRCPLGAAPSDGGSQLRRSIALKLARAMPISLATSSCADSRSCATRRRSAWCHGAVELDQDLSGRRPGRRRGHGSPHDRRFPAAGWSWCGPIGTILPDAVAMMSTWPTDRPATARTKNAMMVPPTARPTGEAGVSRISSAAGRNCTRDARLRARSPAWPRRRLRPTTWSPAWIWCRMA